MPLAFRQWHLYRFDFMVEARGVEPLSESPSVYTSPGAGCCLSFPQAADGSQTAACGSFLIQ